MCRKPELIRANKRRTAELLFSRRLPRTTQGVNCYLGLPGPIDLTHSASRARRRSREPLARHTVGLDERWASIARDENRAHAKASRKNLPDQSTQLPTIEIWGLSAVALLATMVTRGRQQVLRNDIFNVKPSGMTYLALGSGHNLMK